MGIRFTRAKIISAAFAVAILTCGLFLYLFRFDIQFYRHRALILPAARRYSLAPRLVASVIWQESRFRADRVGLTGEVGLMQVMPGTAQEWARAEHLERFGTADLFSPATNVMVGTWCLARAVKRWSDRADPLPYALAEYNAGHSHARRWAAPSDTSPKAYVEAITYPATRKYVREVLDRYRRFGYAP